VQRWMEKVGDEYVYIEASPVWQESNYPIYYILSLPHISCPFHNHYSAQTV